MKTFNKIEFFGAIGISLIGGMAIGYSKAREIFLEALVKATPTNTEKDNSKTKEES